MASISSALSGQLVWTKASHKRDVLRSNGNVVGSLRRASFWSSAFQAESSQGTWTFRRHGCLNASVEIVDCASGFTTAVYRPHWGGPGTIEFSDGQSFRLKSTGLWQPVWTVLSNAGQPVLSIHTRERTVKIENDPGVSEPRLTLLVMLAWHIMRRASEDAAAIAVMVSVTA